MTMNEITLYDFLRELCKDRMTRKQFECFWRVRVLRESGKEVAARLGISQSAVTRHLQRAEKKFWKQANAVKLSVKRWDVWPEVDNFDYFR